MGRMVHSLTAEDTAGRAGGLIGGRGLRVPMIRVRTESMPTGRCFHHKDTEITGRFLGVFVPLW